MTVVAPAPATADAARRVEEAGLNAVQTARQLIYDGWLLRLCPGKAKRARSVNAHFPSTLPLAAKIAHCERIYAAHGLPLLFRITPFAQPAALDAALAAQGYVAFDETLVQTAPLPIALRVPPPPDGTMLAEVDAATFAAIVGELRGSPPGETEAHRERLSHSILTARFLTLREGSRTVCAAQVALDAQCAGVFDVVTAAEARGRGHATFACASLLAWAQRQGARLAYLQVSAGNAPAIAIYRRMGFATLYTYCYRARPGECR